MMNIEYLDSVDSTQRYLKRKLQQGTLNHKDFVVASEQTATYGRYGRLWYYSQDSLAFSFVLEQEKVQKTHEITCFMAFIVHILLRENYRMNTDIKWPNDIYWREKKLGGILVEHCSNFYIIGVGMNVNQDHFPDNLKEYAVSIKQALLYQLDIDRLMMIFIQQFEDYWNIWQYDNKFNIFDAIEKNLLYRGDQVSLSLENEEKYQGILLGVNSDTGAIKLQNHLGSINEYTSGTLRKI